MKIWLWNRLISPASLRTLWCKVSSNCAPLYLPDLKLGFTYSSGTFLLWKAKRSIELLILVWPFASRTALSSPILTTCASLLTQTGLGLTYMRFWSQLWTQGWPLLCRWPHETAKWTDAHSTPGPSRSGNSNHTCCSGFKAFCLYKFESKLIQVIYDFSWNTHHISTAFIRPFLIHN